MRLLHTAVLPLAASFAASLADAGAATASTIPPFDSWPHFRVALQDVSIHLRYLPGSGSPVLLVHGNPQHSLTWREVGPVLASHNYTIIAPDNRGAGDSSLPPDNDYTAQASASDLAGVLEALNITQTYVVSHDKGAGFASALALAHPQRVKRLVLTENVPHGPIYRRFAGPAVWWDLYANWHLALFSVTDAAEFFIRGREKEMLLWYFFHGSYSGPEAFPSEIVERYASSIAKPGFLRAMLGPFSNDVVARDEKFYNETLARNGPSSAPTLTLGGEASIADLIGDLYRGMFPDLVGDVVPKAGHWIADENPTWVANRVASFFAEDPTPLPPVDLSGLENRATLTVGAYGTLQNFALANGLSA